MSIKITGVPLCLIDPLATDLRLVSAPSIFLGRIHRRGGPHLSAGGRITECYVSHNHYGRRPFHQKIEVKKNGKVR
jgi:hypothetical protein